MKQAILIFFILSATLSCAIRGVKTRITGSWYSCAKNGDYVEMHIKGNKYKFSSDFVSPTNWNEFEILKDTFIQYNKYIFEDSLVTNKAIFFFTNKNELKLTYLTSDENWTLHKLTGRIKNVENNLALNNETIKRSKDRKCIDLRTEEERKKDSLDRYILFKF